MINNPKLWAAIFQNSTEGVLITDSQANIQLVNSAFSIITGYSLEEVVGKKPRILSSGRQNAKFYEQMWESLAILGQWQGEIENRRKDGSIYPESLTIIAVREDNGIITNYVGIFRDITTQRDSDDFFKYIATHDQLTDLPNRDRFYDFLNSSVFEAKILHRQIAVLFIDLDGFKTINDTYGHRMGDHLLVTIAGRLVECTKPDGIVARMGGDEFTVILNNLKGKEHAGEVAGRILKVVADPVEIDHVQLQVTASIGISIYPDGIEVATELDDVETLLIQADQAMYAAKDQGKNKFHFCP